MFGRTRRSDQKLDELTYQLCVEMQEMKYTDTPEFKQTLKHLERLYALKGSKDRKGINPDTVLLVLGNLLGIVIIVAYEQRHVWTSKAFGNVIKPR